MTLKISFASFNLYNFQEIEKSVYGNLVSQQLYEEKLQWTRAKLVELNADVIGFQELWSRKCLEDTFDSPGLSDYQLVFINETGDKGWYGIAVAVAIRKPWIIKSKKLHKAFPFTNLCKIDQNDGEDDEVDIRINRFSRTIINLAIINPTKPSLPGINIFVAHLRSKMAARVSDIKPKHREALGSAVSTIRRTAEAAALRWILTEQMKNSTRQTVVIGDLNDDPLSNTLALITEQPTLTTSSRGSDTALYSTLQFQQLSSLRDVFYTHEYNHVKSTLDHILVSQEFFGQSTNALWRHVDTRMWNDHVDDEQVYTSDHGIVKSTFKLK